MYHRYLISITFGIFLGIIFAFKLNFSSQIFFVSFVICILNIFIYKFSKRSFGIFRSKTPLILSLFFFFVAVGIVSGQISISKDIEREDSFTQFISEKESFTGFVSNIEKGLSSQKFILNIIGENNYKLKVVTNLTPEYFSGEKVKITGKIKKDEIVLPDGDKYKRSISYADLNNLDRVNGNISFPKIENLMDSDIQTNLFQKLIYKLENLKLKIINIIKNNLSYYGAALSSGATLGDDSIFSKKDLDTFRKVGLSHIIVLSGFNITILIFAISKIFLFLNLRLKYRVVLSIISIFIFVLFVGASPSIVRASIMGSVLLVSFVFGKSYFAKQGLFLSALLMLLQNPRIAVYDASFHLSFLATFAILYVAPLLKEVKIFKTDDSSSVQKNIKEIFRVSFTIQLILIPYISYTFASVSLLGIFLNILVLPFIPVIMLFSFLGLLLYPISSIFLLIFGFVIQIFSSIIFFFASMVGRLSINSFDWRISWFLFLLIYIILILLISFEMKRSKISSYMNKK